MGIGSPDQMPWWIALPIAAVLWGAYLYSTYKQNKEKK